MMFGGVYETFLMELVAKPLVSIVKLYNQKDVPINTFYQNVAITRTALRDRIVDHWLRHGTTNNYNAKRVIMSIFNEKENDDRFAEIRAAIREKARAEYPDKDADNGDDWTLEENPE